ncbi:MAG TPA: heme o synthase [Thermoanaerobaculia bacterium]|nr:heme o synthase [Thermoanaerobaculia bacterium]
MTALRLRYTASQMPAAQPPLCGTLVPQLRRLARRSSRDPNDLLARPVMKPPALSTPPTPLLAEAPGRPAAATGGRLPRLGVLRLLADLAAMTKPGITAMVVLTAGLGFLLAGRQGGSWQVAHPLRLLLATLLGTGLVAGGASALNQVLEREADGKMRRTAGRPLPAGRLAPDLALLYGVALAVGGMVGLALLVNTLTALLGAAALAGYVFVYTPLKKVSSLATVVGALPGAIPPMMGWTAVRDDFGLAAWVLAGILFFWQMPHFLAIAWLCRQDYAAGGFPMLPVIDPEGGWTARQTVLYGAALVPVSLLPSLLRLTGSLYFAGALVLGIAYLGFCLGFAHRRSTPAARRLMFASLLYLPAVLLVMLLDRAAA